MKYQPIMTDARAGSSRNRSIRLKLPSTLDPSALMATSMIYREELGRPFEMDLELLSQNRNFDFDSILGQNITVTVVLPGAGQDQPPVTRAFNGYVTEMVQTSYDNSDGFYHYRAKVSPWLWLLSLKTDCKSFMDKTVIDILKEVFAECSYAKVRMALNESFYAGNKCRFRVQYRETSLDFVNRLMEDAGIYYFFEHDAATDSHTLVLCDSNANSQAYPGYGELPYRPKLVGFRGDHINEWRIERGMPVKCTALTDYDYTNPKKNLLCTRGTTDTQYEYFDAPGGYYDTGTGTHLAQVRLQELQCRRNLIHGEASALGLSAGYTFKLSDDFPRTDQAGKSYLAVAATLEVSTDAYVTSSQLPESMHRCVFQVLPITVQFRTARRTPKPVVGGPQTAVVTGSGPGPDPGQSPIGSITVLFRWDRDKVASIPVRVSQISAGSSWGSMFIPRVGNEVIVSFEEGDPDRPIITGRVYNFDQLPPLALPAHKTLSYISDDASGEGNAMIFDPTPDKEGILLHSPYNSTTNVTGYASG